MTWVVGACSIFGYGVMISDVRITFEDGSEADLLRKAYRIGPYLLAGFAGSVDIGLRLIDHLQRFLYKPELDSGEPWAWQPEWVIEEWHPFASKIFYAAPMAEQELGSQLIIVGVSPDENMGAPEFPRVYIAQLNWPNFEPAYLAPGLNVCHIGSGSGVEHYTSVISKHFHIGASSLQAEMGGFDGWSQMLGHSVGRLVAENPEPGIGRHVNIDTCRL